MSTLQTIGTLALLGCSRFLSICPFFFCQEIIGKLVVKMLRLGIESNKYVINLLVDFVSHVNMPQDVDCFLMSFSSFLLRLYFLFSFVSAALF